MKKMLILIGLFGLLLLPQGVYAQNYGIRELIPLEIENTLVTHNFSYKRFYYYQKQNWIIFDGIKNLSDEEKPISISIGLFGKNKRNIGTINYCGKDTGEILKANEEESFTIKVNNQYLGNEYSLDDIRYIAVLSDNSNCNVEGSLNYIGQTVQEIGYSKNSILDSSTEMLLKILTVLGAALVGIFLYKFLFTRSYQDIDGEDTRREFKYRNRKLREKRKYEAKVNPPVPKEKKKVKTDEVLEQEENAKNEDKNGSELHNYYK